MKLVEETATTWVADLPSLWKGTSTANWDCTGQTAGILWSADTFRGSMQQHWDQWSRKWRTTVAQHSGNFAITAYCQWSRLVLIVGLLTTASTTRI
eukprot:905796-Pyramimonas_sp.AAC.1